jgi:ATP-dependent helicase/nuclease subunit A
MMSAMDEAPFLHNLTPDQQRAVKTEGRDIIVTAGAGTGKTSTLVGRYLWLLEHRITPRQIAAITFTEKAAREMRNRIRRAVAHRARAEEVDAKRAFWEELEVGMDAARIGTIHSLCSEIMRAHPVEARVDPKFEVVEEGASLALRAKAVESALVWALEDESTAQLYKSFTTEGLRRLIRSLLEHRLDASALFDSEEAAQSDAAIRAALNEFMENELVLGSIAELEVLQDADQLVADAGENLAQRIEMLLEYWEEARTILGGDDLLGAARALYLLRRKGLKRGAGLKGSSAKELQTGLQACYDETLNPWLGGAASSDTQPDKALEELWVETYHRVKRLFIQACKEYAQALDRQSALDFDDLEFGAMQLLANQNVAKRWQSEIAAILVDEFQDTNERQRTIIDSLCGDEIGKLFIVGDARQSIYRFRGADVSVFRRVEREIKSRRGVHVELKKTFRAHKGLLAEIDGLLAPIMGTEDDPDRLYAVPYSNLEAHRSVAKSNLGPPYTEVILGLGQGAGAARYRAAEALAGRLSVYKAAGWVESWDKVALLFRASTAFSVYEDALELAGIPFVTVAGSGFYDRPEIRDLLNILRAISEPWNDAALAGLLRSPAFRISDPGLYALRIPNDEPVPLQDALAGDLAHLSEDDQAAALHAREFLQQFRPMVDRMTVAELLKRVVDYLDYRAILAISHTRLWRNLDKLLQDAERSGLVNIRAFFEYLRSMRDIGAREGEAPTEALGAVQLMTIHKAKGLEFSTVVLADASRGSVLRREPSYLLEETGPAFRIERSMGEPLIYKLAERLDKQQSMAEETRILYVAATRARERLILSGHLSLQRGAYAANGWMKSFLELLDLNPRELGANPGQDHTASLPDGSKVLVSVAADENLRAARDTPRDIWPSSKLKTIYTPLAAVDMGRFDDYLELERDWRATGTRQHAPAVVVGAMVHEIIRRWSFPGSAARLNTLNTLALEAGLIDADQRRRAVNEAEILINRLEEHPIVNEIEDAEERYHELPYSRPHPSWTVDSGRIDLLYKVKGEWMVIDFKTDELRDEDALHRAVEEYQPQMNRYREAVQQLLHIQPVTSICFLDAMGVIRLVPL